MASKVLNREHEEYSMPFALFTDVIVTCDIPEENLKTGDVGTVVERHDVSGLEPGYSVEIFDMLGNTVAVVTVPGSMLRTPDAGDRSLPS